MRKYSISLVIITIFVLSISCTNPIDKQYSNNIPKLFIDSINAESLELPATISMIDKNYDTLLYKSYLEEEAYVFKLFFNRTGIDTLVISNTIGFNVFKEGDLDGDGFDEIGILNAYPNSSCRMYSIYGIENLKWKEKYKVLTHLPDRADKTDYFKFDGNKLRIINAKRDSCCQCSGLDTIFKIIK